MLFRSHGKVSFDRMLKLIKGYVDQEPEYTYRITVGTDSQNFGITKTVVVVAVHRVGKGGIFFYEVKTVRKITNIEQKLLYETSQSLDLAMKLSERLKDDSLPCELDIHIDAGPNGPSSVVIPEIAGWVRSCGFACTFKPDSYTASSIANRISK